VESEAARAREARWIVAVFVGLVTVGIWHHEQFRDEAFGLLMVSAAGSLAEIIVQSFLSGYPPGWYLILAAGRLLTPAPIAPAVINATFAAGAVYLVARYSPLSRVQRWLFACGFFPLFQYGVVARPYGAVIFLLFLYCALQQRLKERPWLTVLPLLLLPWMHFFGAMVAGVAAVIETARLVAEGQLRANRRVLAALTAVALSAALVALILMNVPRGSLAPESIRWYMVVRAVATGFLPTIAGPVTRYVRWPGALLFGLSWACLLHRPRALAYYAIPSAGLVAFILLIYKGGPWHYGFFFLFFMIALWLGWQERPPVRAWQRGFVTLVLAFHAATGLQILAHDVRYPFSGGYGAAMAIRQYLPEDAALVGVLWDGSVYRFTLAEAQSTLVYLPGQRIYDPIARVQERYWRHYAHPGYFDESELPAAAFAESLDLVAQELQRDLTLIVVRPNGTELAELPPPAERIDDIPSVDFWYSESVSVFRWPLRDTGLGVEPPE